MRGSISTTSGQIEGEVVEGEVAQVPHQPRPLFELGDDDRVRRRERGIDGAVRDGPGEHPRPARRPLPGGVERAARRASIPRRVPPGAAAGAALDPQLAPREVL